MIDLLQAARAPAVVRGPAAQHHHRRPVEVRGGDRADAVGHAGPGGDHGQAGGPGQPGRGLGREHRGLLVPDVDDRHRRLGPGGRVVQGEHVPAGQREQVGHAVPPRYLEGQYPAVPPVRLLITHLAMLPTS